MSKNSKTYHNDNTRLEHTNHWQAKVAWTVWPQPTCVESVASSHTRYSCGATKWKAFMHEYRNSSDSLTILLYTWIKRVIAKVQGRSAPQECVLVFLTTLARGRLRWKVSAPCSSCTYSGMFLGCATLWIHRILCCTKVDNFDDLY